MVSRQQPAKSPSNQQGSESSGSAANRLRIKVPRTHLFGVLLSMLDRKMLRELVESRGQHLAIATVVASGVAVFVMSLSVLNFLRDTRDAYYERYRFGNVFASLVRAPAPVASQLAHISGILQSEDRIVTDVTLDVPGLEEPAVGRLVSIPMVGEPMLNRIHLVQGRLPQPQRFGEVIAGEAFFQANELDLGDQISAIINGRLQPLRIVGVGLSPEYVFQIRGGEVLPDDRRFGVFWMSREGLEAATDMEGAFNSFSATLHHGANTEEVLDRIDSVLEPFGGIGAISREDQISAKFLNDEIRQLRATGLVAPSIFFGVAAFLLNVVLTRKVLGDRESIAALRAFGYQPWEIALHYLKSAVFVTACGAIVGAIGGHMMGRGLADLYAEFYRFPDFVFRPDWSVLVPAVLASLIAAVIGTYRSLREVIRLKPAEAMRPPAPTTFKPTWLERLGFFVLLPLMGRMIVRQLGRRLISSTLATIGIACAVSVMILASFAPDALDYLIYFQFEQVQRQDVQVTLKEPASSDAMHNLISMPGVLHVEPVRAVAVDIQHQHLDYRTGILGIGDEPVLYRLLVDDGRPYSLPPGGIVLSDHLAKQLRVAAGDTVTVDVLEGERPTVSLQVSGIVKELVGANAYMRLPGLHSLMREGNVITGAFISVDTNYLPELYQELKNTPAIAGVSVKQTAIDQFQETVAQNTLKMQGFTLFFAAVIAVGVVYNTARVSLDERARELATMRVIGFTRGEISILLLGELGLLTVLAIPLGWALGYGFCWAMVTAFESENFRIPLVIEASSCGRAALITMIAAVVSGLVVRRRLDHLDLVEVLKSR